MTRVAKSVIDKRFAALCKRIEASNDAFKVASPAERVLAVARDVLSMLDAGRLRATHGLYVSGKLPGGVDGYEQRGKDLSEILRLPKLPPCRVCAIGAAMVACTLRLDEVKFGEVADSFGPTFGESYVFYRDDRMTGNAREVFSADLLAAMEHAFESGSYGYKSVRMGEARMRAIYDNLVKNRGRKFTTHAPALYQGQRVPRGHTVVGVA